jgi:CBS domain-containing protein
MAQMPDTKTATSDQTTQSDAERKAEAAASQTTAAQHAAKASSQATTRHEGETLQQASKETGGSIHRSGEASAGATQFASRVGTETVRRAADRLTEGQQALASDMADYFKTLSEQMARAMQESTSDLCGFIVPRQGAVENLRDLQDGMSDLVAGVIHSNIRMTRELLQMAKPGAAFDLQRRFMRDYMDGLLQGSNAIIQAARRSADQAVQPFQDRVKQGGRGHQFVVSDVMSSDVRLVTPDDTVQQATRMMRDEDTGVLPVGENDRLIGVVTDRDVSLRVVAEGKDPQRTKVREVMSTEPKYVFEDEDLEHVADNMAQQQIRRLPVVNRSKRLVGVVSIGDLTRGDRSGSLTGRAMRGVIRPGASENARTAAE